MQRPPDLLPLRLKKYRVPAIIGIVAIVVVAAGIFAVVESGVFLSPKQKIVRAADQECATINDRFAGELAFGESIDLATGGPKLLQRAVLVNELAHHVRGMPPPEAGQADLLTWLEKLSGYAKANTTFRNDFSLPPNADIIRAFDAAIVDGAADEAATAARKFGFRTCGDVRSWKAFPK